MRLKSSLLTLALLTSCTTDTEVIWVPDVYNADHIKQEIKGETGSAIACKDASFSEMVCIGKSDFVRLYDHCLKAK